MMLGGKNGPYGIFDFRRAITLKLSQVRIRLKLYVTRVMTLSINTLSLEMSLCIT